MDATETHEIRHELWQIKVPEHFFHCSVGSSCLSICSQMICSGSEERGAKRHWKLLSQHAGQEGVPVTDHLTLHSICFESFRNMSTNFVPMGRPQHFATVSAIWQICSRNSAISISIYKITKKIASLVSHSTEWGHHNLSLHFELCQSGRLAQDTADDRPRLL